jgi:hypothetical protein
MRGINPESGPMLLTLNWPPSRPPAQITANASCFPFLSHIFFLFHTLDNDDKPLAVAVRHQCALNTVLCLFLSFLMIFSLHFAQYVRDNDDADTHSLTTLTTPLFFTTGPDYSIGTDVFKQPSLVEDGTELIVSCVFLSSFHIPISHNFSSLFSWTTIHSHSH